MFCTQDYVSEHFGIFWNRSIFHTYCSNRLGDMVPTVGRPVPQLNMIISEMTNLLYRIMGTSLLLLNKSDFSCNHLLMLYMALGNFSQTVGVL